jgi:hypothetical protein
MAQTVTASIPLHDLPPPRVLEELSSQIGSKASTAINELSEHARAWEKSVPSSAFGDYLRDSWQRSVLFMDILRQRGNQHNEMVLHGVSSVLIYDSELIMRGDELAGNAA